MKLQPGRAQLLVSVEESTGMNETRDVEVVQTYKRKLHNDVQHIFRSYYIPIVLPQFG